MRWGRGSFSFQERYRHRVTLTGRETGVGDRGRETSVSQGGVYLDCPRTGDGKGNGPGIRRGPWEGWRRFRTDFPVVKTLRVRLAGVRSRYMDERKKKRGIGHNGDLCDILSQKT